MPTCRQELRSSACWATGRRRCPRALSVRLRRPHVDWPCGEIVSASARTASAHPIWRWESPNSGATAGGTIRLRWTATARIPMTPLRVELSTFDGTRYVPHRLALHLDVRPDPAAAPGQAALPPFLTTFRPLPSSPPETMRVGLTRGVGSALAGGLAGLALALLARRRDLRRTPAGRRHAALSRLRHARITQMDQVPTMYRDLRTYLDLPPGASAAHIVAATQVRWPQLASELEGLERRRFDPSASTAVNTNRLAALRWRLAALVVLALTAAVGAESTNSAPLASAELAFHRQDYREACLALMQLRRRTGDFELLMNSNALWFTGRHVEALALYEGLTTRTPPCRPPPRDCLAAPRGPRRRPWHGLAVPPALARRAPPRRVAVHRRTACWSGCPRGRLLSLAATPRCTRPDRRWPRGGAVPSPGRGAPPDPTGEATRDD